MARDLPQIALEMPSEAREVLGSLGRTEDIRLAPNGRRVAIACYWRDGIAVGDVELARTPSGPAAALTRLELLNSPVLREPHGLDWRDDETLVVANRAGGVALLRLADGELVPIGAPVEVDAPGSLAVRPLDGRFHEVLVCENWRNEIARLVILEHGDIRVAPAAQRAWLDLPDGVALGRDGRWLAVSNHNTHTVFVFDREAGENGDPAAVLRGVDYPHGLQFAADDSVLLVADAGAPYVHVFSRPGEAWRGASFPAASVAVLDDPTFRRGRRNPMEGGPKGIDLDPSTDVLMVTCEELPLAFFDAAALLERPEELGADADALLRHELEALGAVQRERQETERVRAELAAIVATKAWRLTGPARRLYGGLRGAARRGRSAGGGLSTAGDVSQREAADPSP
jgi:Lipoprotein LpqB beta-propeller domain